MSNGPHRRQLLKAAAGSGIDSSIAGCLGTFEAGNGATSPGSTADRGSNVDLSSRSPRGRACSIGADLITALGDADFETAVSYYPYEYLEGEAVDSATLAEELEQSDWNHEWVDGEVEDVSCECAQAVPADGLDELDADVTGDVTAALELRYAVTHETDGGTATDTVYVNAVEIDGDWSAMLSIGGSRDRCAPESEFDDEGYGSESDSESDDEQSLDGTVWEDVDEIVLEANVTGWVGVEPAPIEGVENPTLLLFEGHEYEIEWRHGDSAIHNFQIRDVDDESLAETELAEPDQTPVSLTIHATAAMDEYVCEPHADMMVGDIVVEPR